ncbi:nitroreductase family protein [Aequorivita echinoideorum]|uniref:Nitroreductase family protein n=1 Tax=Aequorivita echinoideorum TaxID=1549647 RepID=A0ABS5S632_9FLAO|nr:nitroreductase family protein [Aequorivita echinoideorum]MBT0608675.1 nitroreductase family protein [Aequorivita echinoideorum]
MNVKQEHLKETNPEHEILDILKNRWSPRAFSDKKITEKEVKILLEAGRWAPSAFNVQPWRIIWGIKGTETYDRLYNCLDEFNQSWADNAQVLMAGAFKKTKEGDKENFHALHDLGLFMANVYTQAHSMGIATHQMAGIDFKKAQKEFKIPEDFHVATGIALGYYGGDASVLPEDLQEKENKQKRERKPQSEFAFNGNFQNKN